jgi:hypothetical protein
MDDKLKKLLKFKLSNRMEGVVGTARKAIAGCPMKVCYIWHNGRCQNSQHQVIIGLRNVYVKVRYLSEDFHGHHRLHA